MAYVIEWIDASLPCRVYIRSKEKKCRFYTVLTIHFEHKSPYSPAIVNQAHAGQDNALVNMVRELRIILHPWSVIQGKISLGRNAEKEHHDVMKWIKAPSSLGFFQPNLIRVHVFIFLYCIKLPI